MVAALLTRGVGGRRNAAQVQAEGTALDHRRLASQLRQALHEGQASAVLKTGFLPGTSTKLCIDIVRSAGQICDCFGAGRWRGCSSFTPARTAMSPTSSSRSTQSVSSWPFSPLASDHSRHSEYPAFSRLPVQKPDRNGSSSADVCKLAIGLLASSGII